MTTPQMRRRAKFVTRRLGWLKLKPGTVLNAVVKCQGLKKGERVERICQIVVKAVRRERLDRITKREVELEGFPEMSPAEFVRMFCDHNRKKFVTPATVVTRIRFAFVDD